MGFILNVQSRQYAFNHIISAWLPFGAIDSAGRAGMGLVMQLALVVILHSSMQG
jgi:hypothetical protein